MFTYFEKFYQLQAKEGKVTTTYKPFPTLIILNVVIPSFQCVKIAKCKKSCILINFLII